MRPLRQKKAGRNFMIENITLKGCMKFAVATEELGTKIYARLAAKFADSKDIAQLFSRLSEDEKVHKHQFEELLRKAPADEATNSSPEELDYIRAMSHSEFFSHDRSPFRDMDKVRDRNDALQKALDFEKATLGFYKAVEESLGEYELLAQVIETERSHVVALVKALLVEGSEFRSLQDRWP